MWRTPPENVPGECGTFYVEPTDIITQSLVYFLLYIQTNSHSAKVQGIRIIYGLKAILKGYVEHQCGTVHLNYGIFCQL